MNMLENSDIEVSVLVPFFNEEKFLPEAVESVFAQTFTNWEILLIDDGSSDKSTAMACSYASKFPGRVIYLEHPDHRNQGLSASRKLGLENASGKFIALLDADDYWYPQKLEFQLNIMNEHPHVSLICETSEYWYSWADKERDDVLIPVGAPQDRPISAPLLMTELYPLGTGAAPCPSGMLIHKETLKKHGDFEAAFSGIYQMYEDQAFLAKLYLNETVYVSSGCYDRYRQREGSLVASVYEKDQYHQVRKFYLDWLTAYMKKQGISNPTVKTALMQAKRAYSTPNIFQKIIRKLV